MPYPIALAVTLAAELPVYLLVFRFTGLFGWRRGVAAAVGLNLGTHPVVWLVLSAHPGWFVSVEAAVCAVEGGLLWWFAGRREPGLLLLTAVVANLTSILAGFVLVRLGAGG